MEGRDRLIIRMFLVLGPRPGELFAFRRNDRVGHNYIRVDEAISPLAGIVEPKSDSSTAFIWMPQSLGIELDSGWKLSKTKGRKRFSLRRAKVLPSAPTTS